jgi:RNA polymerase sigma-70 factor (ECF subfamily)
MSNSNSIDRNQDQELSELSDQQLVARFQAGDKDVLSEFLKRYNSRIYRLAYGILRNPQDAEEVIQEVFLRLFQKLDSFKGESSFSSWLYRVAINTTYMKLREKKGADMLPLEIVGKFLDEQAEKQGSADWMSRPDDELLTEESLKLISDAIEQLPDDFKTVLILRDVDCLSTEEVGQLLGLSPPAVKSRLHRARLFLRKKLEDFYKQFSEGG